ncbi:hypothetical protein F0L17_26530 [Streptomyces sp. TRM43335]|uniref:Uncharacterized protein n=1 Tax=Streptomyces taklimakanensis TaxID=2569853 RepID=A0A6G2BJX9_9ACTN|nr:replication/maintenance protein RepL [Streptomyces taklimakanensis]MTE22587.1 hypothetical protein [Streptomyces taklimakanensis]
MTSDPPTPPPVGPRPLAPQDGGPGFDDILVALGKQLGETVESTRQASGSRKKLKGVTFEYEQEPRTVHDMAGDQGYSIASNWFTQFLAQLAVANSVTKSEMCVFLYVAGGQIAGTGIAQYTQQEITDGLNKEAHRIGARRITRSTVNRAIKALCEYGWLEKHGNGRIRLNVRLWFRGNSTAQQAVLADLEREHGRDPQAFPHRIGPHHGEQQALDLALDDPPPPTRQERTG